MNKLLGALRKVYVWLAESSYEIALSVVCFLVAVEILGTWACWGVLIVSLIVWAYRKVKRYEKNLK